MNLAWHLILWFSTIFIISQIRLGYVLYITPTRRHWMDDINVNQAVAYMRRTGATALPLHYDPETNSWFLIEPKDEQVNWGRDGF